LLASIYYFTGEQVLLCWRAQSKILRYFLVKVPEEIIFSPELFIFSQVLFPLQELRDGTKPRMKRGILKAKPLKSSNC